MNPSRAREKINLQITMAGLARVHDRYLRGCQWGLVLGDSLDKDLRWIAEIERILIGSGYYSEADVRHKHLEINVHWVPEHDRKEEPN